MKTMIYAAIASALVTSAAAAQTADPGQSTGPTCSSQLGIANHGQHIVGDYVSGLGGAFPPGELGWPPEGRDVGEAVRENGGALVPGGPGPGFHFPNGAAPGASFCTDSASDGFHL